jgi:hypothetical protein
MKLADTRGAYETLSGKASDIVRQLSLAAVGLVWIFKSTTGPSYSLDPTLVRASLLIFVALFLDLLQYLVGTATWFSYFHKKERENTKEDDEFKAPNFINAPTWTLFWLKAASMAAAYGLFILPFLFHRFVAGH